MADVGGDPIVRRWSCAALISDLLTHEAAEEMTRRGPKATLIEFPGIGHAPALVAEDQIGIVRDFLLA